MRDNLGRFLDFGEYLWPTPGNGTSKRFFYGDPKTELHNHGRRLASSTDVSQ
jgi:hypothetical protein